MPKMITKAAAIKSIQLEIDKHIEKYGYSDSGEKSEDQSWVKMMFLDVVKSSIEQGTVKPDATEIPFDNFTVYRDGSFQRTGTIKQVIAEAWQKRLFSDVMGDYDVLEGIMKDYPKSKILGKV